MIIINSIMLTLSRRIHSVTTFCKAAVLDVEKRACNVQFLTKICVQPD
jgi:hypothetical protein